jgi:hypothetical protein
VRAEFPHAQLRDPRVAAAPAAEAGPTTAATGTAAFPDVADGGSLARETELLERARNALDSDPAASIALTDEHRLRFAQPFLAAECEFIRVEALHRLGRDQEARALAQILIARDTRGLYRERLRRLLE